MPLRTTTWEGSHQPPGSPPGWPSYVPQDFVFREVPLKSSAKTICQPGRLPAGMGMPDGVAAETTPGFVPGIGGRDRFGELGVGPELEPGEGAWGRPGATPS